MKKQRRKPSILRAILISFLVGTISIVTASILRYSPLSILLYIIGTISWFVFFAKIIRAKKPSKSKLPLSTLSEPSGSFINFPCDLPALNWDLRKREQELKVCLEWAERLEAVGPESCLNQRIKETQLKTGTQLLSFSLSELESIPDISEEYQKSASKNAKTRSRL